MRKKIFAVFAIILLLFPAYPLWAAIAQEMQAQRKAGSLGAENNFNWKKLFIDYINDNPVDDPVSPCYSLIYINDDDIPELWIDYGVGYRGNALCTISGEELDVINFYHDGLSYIERQNLFLLSGGRMDNFSDYVYCIQNNGFVRLYTGNYGAGNFSSAEYNAEGNPIYRYYWDEKEVSEKVYERLLNSVFDVSKAVNPRENNCSASEIITKIKNLSIAGKADNEITPFSATASAADDRLVGTWKWEDCVEEDGEEHYYSLTLTFNEDGVVKIEPVYYDHAPDIAYGNYDADGQFLRVVVTKVIRFFEDEDSVFFEVGETINEPYQCRSGRLVMRFLGGEMVFERVK